MSLRLAHQPSGHFSQRLERVSDKICNSRKYNVSVSSTSLQTVNNKTHGPFLLCEINVFIHFYPPSQSFFYYSVSQKFACNTLQK